MKTQDIYNDILSSLIEVEDGKVTKEKDAPKRLKVMASFLAKKDDIEAKINTAKGKAVFTAYNRLQSNKIISSMETYGVKGEAKKQKVYQMSGFKPDAAADDKCDNAMVSRILKCGEISVIGYSLEKDSIVKSQTTATGIISCPSNGSGDKTDRALEPAEKEGLKVTQPVKVVTITQAKDIQELYGHITKVIEDVTAWMEDDKKTTPEIVQALEDLDDDIQIIFE